MSAVVSWESWSSFKMHWLYIFRMVSFVATISFAIVVLGLSVRATNHPVPIFTDSMYMLFPRIAIVLAVFTLISLLFVVVRDCISAPVSIRAEAVVLLIHCAAWVSVGILTFLQRSGHFPGECDISRQPSGISCENQEPMAIFSLVTGGILLVYVIVLLLVAVHSASCGVPIWTSSVKPPQKKRKKSSIFV
ncbi:hypothetical protein C8Q80DRAFT_937509 [Daedaleopsis nitida]|nr:hypothetical protein C8Q80DRAFT_937509 [Daedaleopsis nitida]